ncbi:MAG: aryl-sulfate sulfotransferase [Polaribacter sp.]
MHKKIILFVLILLVEYNFAQETIGLVFNDVSKTKSNGYTLINPISDSRTFLINNCGEVVHQWDFSGEDARNYYLLENGNIFQSSGLYAEIRDWDNNILWSITYQSVLGFRIHHDIQPLPNGNFLVLVRDNYTNTEMFAAGMDTSYPNDVLVLERIVEIKPVGTNSAEIVWEWKLFDHLVQEFDSTKPNYGIVANNPQLLDMNYEDGEGSNPIHANAIDYNESLDQIVFSARHLKEVFVIDHSTTTAEAASHSGGIYGKGGDFLWRWGNPEVYNQGTISDRKLGRQHDIKWITEGPDKGKMSVFSNDGYGTNTAFSSVHIIDQNATNGVYTLEADKFLPNDYFWSWDGTIMGTPMLGDAQCGVQIMSNGNALINETINGRITEVDREGNVIWVYIIPVGNNTNYSQFTTEISGNNAFRAHRYAENYAGFNGKTFNNTGIIEDVNSISAACSASLSVENLYFSDLRVYPNPTKSYLNFSLQMDEIKVFDVSGKTVLSTKNSKNINLENLVKGLYFVKILSEENSKIIKVLKN